MRLIDADALKDKFKAHYDLFVGDYKGEHMSLADELRVDEILNSMAEVINAPTVFDTDNATNGDVIKAVFQQWKILDYADKDMIMFNIPMKVGYEFNACSREWWNAPYQKGGKE